MIKINENNTNSEVFTARYIGKTLPDFVNNGSYHITIKRGKETILITKATAYKFVVYKTEKEFKNNWIEIKLIN